MSQDDEKERQRIGLLARSQDADKAADDITEQRMRLIRAALADGATPLALGTEAAGYLAKKSMLNTKLHDEGVATSLAMATIVMGVMYMSLTNIEEEDFLARMKVAIRKFAYTKFKEAQAL